MNITRTLTRRDFIKVVSTGGTGLVLAFYLPSARDLDALSLEPAEEFVPNAWLKIDPQGNVTITVARSEMGQGVRTSLPMIVAEELEADWTKVRIEQAPAHPDKYGSQATGGSTSVRRSWDMLRKAGATAREMLIAAAAQQWSVERASCSARNGMVFHDASGKKARYGELVQAAAKMPVPENPPLKDPNDFRVIGTRTPRLDTPQKVNGTAVFGIDVKVPKMLYATVARSPVFGGKVMSFDASKAKSVAGVRDVIPFDGGIAILASSTWAAIQGREALSATWDEGPHAKQNSEGIWKMFEEAAQLEGATEKKEGDVIAALATAVKKVGAVYRAPFVAHATMEPMNCLADVRSDYCEIWAPSQTPQRAQSEAASVLGLPIDKVRVNVTLMGGGFGRRLEADYVTEAVKISKAAGVPVMVVWTREDDMQHDFYRPATYNVLTAGLDKEGWPIAWTHRIVGPSSKGLVVGGSAPPYSIPNLLIDYHIKETGVPIGAWRSVGYSQNTFVIESFIDELAHAAGKDPAEYRRQLLDKSPRLKAALDLALFKSEWGKKLPPGMGRGVAAVQGFGSSVAHVAEVSVSKEGEVRVLRVVSAVECGPVVNPDTIEAQIESAIVYGLSAALKDEITIAKGRVKQSNFDDYGILHIDEMPKVEVHIVPSKEPLGGIGEPGVPPIAPAVCNAIFAATGKRIRKLPIRPEDLRAS